MSTRTIVLFALAAIGFVVAALGLFVGLVMFFSPNEGETGLYARRGGIFLTFFFGVLPAAVSALFVSVGTRQRSRFQKLAELAAVARQSRSFTASDVARGLGTTMQLAERIIVDASTLGLIEEGEPVQGLATTVAGPEASRSLGSVEPGSVLGGTYRVEEPLGKGGMGVVFAARHMRTGRRYAVKTILAGPRADEAMMRRFEREATAASAIGHPGIVQVHDFNVAEGGIFYLVMDLLEGETLAQRIARTGPLPWVDVQRVACEIASALAAAHEQGLLHRDIKPSNVFLAKARGAQERAVLVDFGLVKPIDESNAVTSTGAVLGTPMYMSPEQARGEPLDVRSDVYSLGAVVFEALTGAPPFVDRTLAGVYAKILNEPSPRASSVSQRRIPRAVDEVLARVLSKDRAARYADARSFGQALSAVVEEAPSTERMAN